MMTTKNYEEVARLVKAHLAAELDLQEDGEITPSQEAICSLTRGLANMFKRDNPRFNSGTFFLACGLDSYGFITENLVARQYAKDPDA